MWLGIILIVSLSIMIVWETIDIVKKVKEKKKGKKENVSKNDKERP